MPYWNYDKNVRIATSSSANEQQHFLIIIIVVVVILYSAQITLLRIETVQMSTKLMWNIIVFKRLHHCLQF